MISQVAVAVRPTPASSASVWTTPDHGMILTVAVPVQRYKQVLGAVMLSRGGTQIDAAILHLVEERRELLAGEDPDLVVVAGAGAGLLIRSVANLNSFVHFC